MHSIPSPSPMLVALPAPDGSTAIDAARSISRSGRTEVKSLVLHLALLPMDQHMMPIMNAKFLVDMQLMSLALHRVLDMLKVLLLVLLQPPFCLNRFFCFINLSY